LELTGCARKYERLSSEIVKSTVFIFTSPPTLKDRRKIHYGFDARLCYRIQNALGERRGNGDDRDIYLIFFGDAGKIFDVENLDRRRLFFRFFFGQRRTSQRPKNSSASNRNNQPARSQTTRADNRHAMPGVESENFRQMLAQIVHVITDAAHAELAEISQILANLRRIQMKLFCQARRRNGFLALRKRVRSDSAGKRSFGSWLIRYFLDLHFLC
jgi:hypothetical protein